MMMRHAAVAILLAATAIPAASAQSYLAREKLFPSEAKPIVEEPAVWTTGTWSAWSEACSNDMTIRTRSVSCMSGDKVKADADCTGAKPNSSETRSAYAGCTGLRWVASDPQKIFGCGTVERHKIVYDIKSRCVSNGKVVADSTCSSLTKPSGESFSSCNQYNNCQKYLNGYGSQGGYVLTGPNVFIIGTTTPTGVQSTTNAGNELCATYKNTLAACSVRTNADGKTVSAYGVLPGRSYSVVDTGRSNLDQANACGW